MNVPLYQSQHMSMSIGKFMLSFVFSTGIFIEYRDYQDDMPAPTDLGPTA